MSKVRVAGLARLLIQYLSELIAISEELGEVLTQ
jgi:hypothetical protein